MNRSTLISCALGLMMLGGCASAYKKSVGAEIDRPVVRIFVTTRDIAWQASLDALKSYRLDISNRDSGLIQTRWKENTLERNFVDSFGESGAYIKAQYRFKVNVDKGYFDGKEAIKITIVKQQLVQRDVLEGLKRIESDLVAERTMLYRVGRLIRIRLQLEYEEKLKTNRELKERGDDFKFNDDGLEKDGSEDLETEASETNDEPKVDSKEDGDGDPAFDEPLDDEFE